MLPTRSAAASHLPKGAPPWVTLELLVRAQALFSRRSSIELTAEDALENGKILGIFLTFWTTEMVKRFVALARVSSCEQEREGFSLEVQQAALVNYARQQGGEITKLFRIAEAATRPEERRTFHELLSYVRSHASELAGVLFYKVDRAARNLFD